jgi:hypothetical protein
VLYAAYTQSWPKPLLWVVLGVVFVFLPVLLGAFCGHLGALLAKVTRSIPG